MKAWVGAAAAVILVLSILAAGWLGRPADGSTGAGWDEAGVDGHSDLAQTLASGFKVRPIEGSLGLLPRSAGDGDVLFLFPTHRPATSQEIATTRDYVDRGGILVMAADGAHGAAWAEAFGYRFQGLPALLPRSAQEDCIEVEVPVARKTHVLCLPSPTAMPDLPVVIGGGASFNFLANASLPIYMDVDGNGNLSLGDQGPETFPLAAGWSYGEGTVFAIADGDFLRNGNITKMPGNLEFARAIASLTHDDGIVYLDSSAGPRDNAKLLAIPLFHTLSAPYFVEVIALGMLLFGLVAVSIAIPYATLWRRHDPAAHEIDDNLETVAHELIERALKGRASPADNSNQRE